MVNGKPVAKEKNSMTTIAPPQQAVELTRGGRLFGRPEQTVQSRARQDPAPEIGKIFIDDLVTKSAILALTTTSGRDEIITAYGADIAALAQRRNEADAFMLRILTCAMDRFSVDKDQHAAEKEALRSLLEPLGIAPQIALSGKRLAMPPEQLVDWLKTEFRSETDRIARRIATTLHYLADFNIVGLVDWLTADVCTFHYFTWSADHSSSSKTERTGDIMAWNTLITRVNHTTTLRRTRHTHHVVNAGMHLVTDYKGKMPKRVKRLIESAPAWLKPYLVVIDGTETLSERVTAVASEQTEQTVHSVVRYDPAIAIGPFILTGWNESEVDPSWWSRFRKNVRTAKDVALFGLFAVCLIWGFFSMLRAIASGLKWLLP